MKTITTLIAASFIGLATACCADSVVSTDSGQFLEHIVSCLALMRNATDETNSTLLGLSSGTVSLIDVKAAFQSGMKKVEEASAALGPYRKESDERMKKVVGNYDVGIKEARLFYTTNLDLFKSYDVKKSAVNEQDAFVRRLKKNIADHQTVFQTIRDGSIGVMEIVSVRVLLEIWRGPNSAEANALMKKHLEAFPNAAEKKVVWRDGLEASGYIIYETLSSFTIRRDLLGRPL